MATAINDTLYNGTALAPRSSLRVVHGGVARMPPNQLADPAASLGVVSTTFSAPVGMTQTPYTGDPVAANVAFKSMNVIAPEHTGITIHNAGIRAHKATQEYMASRNKIVERVEKDPYTGRTITYYRDEIPEGNADYRVPKETMKKVGRRLVALQGYDHTRPKPTRREQLRETFQPDASHQDAAMYERRMGEMEERALRSIQNNHDGERPVWVRDTQRAFGFRGYHNMLRPMPYVPTTMRPDTENLHPTMDLAMNPNPANEIWTQGIHRTAPRRPHYEKNIYSAPFTAPVTRLPTQGSVDSVGNHRADTIVQGYEGPMSGPERGTVPSGEIRHNTKRSGQTSEGLEAPKTGPSLPPLTGSSDSKGQHRAETELAGYEGPTTFPVNMPPIISAEMRNTNKRDGTTTEGLEAPRTGPSLPPLMGASDNVGQHREETELAGYEGPATFPVNMPPVVSAEMRNNNKRDGTEARMGMVSGPELGTVQSGHIRGNTKRDGIYDVLTAGNAEFVGGLTVRSAVRAPNRRKGDLTTQEAGELSRITDGLVTAGSSTDFKGTYTKRGRRFGEVTQEGLLTGGSVESMGATLRGSQDDRLAVSGKRAFTGGSAMDSPGPGQGGGVVGVGVINRNQVGSRTNLTGDSTVVNMASLSWGRNGRVIGT